MYFSWYSNMFRWCPYIYFANDFPRLSHHCPTFPHVFLVYYYFSHHFPACSYSFPDMFPWLSTFPTLSLHFPLISRHFPTTFRKKTTGENTMRRALVRQGAPAPSPGGPLRREPEPDLWDFWLSVVLREKWRNDHPSPYSKRSSFYEFGVPKIDGATPQKMDDINGKYSSANGWELGVPVFFGDLHMGIDACQKSWSSWPKATCCKCQFYPMKYPQL